MDGLSPASIPLAVMLSVLGAVGVAVGLRQPGRSQRWLVVGGAALFSGMLGVFGAPASVQLGVLVVASAAGALLAWRWRSLVAAGDTLPTGAGAVRLVGMAGEVIETIPAGDGADGWNDLSSGDRPAVRAGDRDPARPVGRVRVGGEIWRAQSREGTEIASGSTVIVMAIRGTRLVVALADAADQSAEEETDPESGSSRDVEDR